jgi:3-methyl-2-oxobutanoate hydroxymethyltransferase
VVADMPWMSYHVSEEETVRNAALLMRAGASSVKLEGGVKRVPMIEAIVDAEIPVMGHIGLTPQSVNALGGFKVQGKSLAAAEKLVSDAKALEAAGCFAIVLEAIPDAVARMITEAITIPTIGIGAGPQCDGQVLVWHDLLGIEDRLAPKFVRKYDDLGIQSVEAIAKYAADVRSGAFPGPGESYVATDELAASILALGTDTAEVTAEDVKALASFDGLDDPFGDALIALYS